MFHGFGGRRGLGFWLGALDLGDRRFFPWRGGGERFTDHFLNLNLGHHFVRFGVRLVRQILFPHTLNLELGRLEILVRDQEDLNALTGLDSGHVVALLVQ